MSEPARQLLLLRHAKAVTAQPGMSDASDHARPLSARGRADASALGVQLRARALLPDMALVSTSRRTRETADLLGLDGEVDAEDGGTRLVLSDALYLASAAGLLDALREQSGGARRVLLIGHNPGLHELALHLATDNAVLAQGLPTCALAAFDIDGEWSDLAPARARLCSISRP